ncbi:MAG: FkbM family methyltransferase [Lachnospiraceae bacterium]|nr:FkbM family methyltransferase [Lachnospiraceae bacterium]
MDKREALLETINRVERRHYRFDPEIERFYEAVQRNKYLCIFGAGEIFSETAFFLREAGVAVDCVCDNDPAKHGKVFYGHKCISYEQLKEMKDEVTVFISSSYYVEIEKQLQQDGFADCFAFYPRFLPKYDVKALFGEEKESIIAAFDLFADDISKEIYLLHVLHATDSLYYPSFNKLPFSANQYFDEEIVPLSEHEVFADIGAFDGADVRRFLSLTKESFERIYCFELSKINFVMLRDNIAKLPATVREAVECINKGVSDANGVFSYSDDFGMSSNLSAAEAGGDSMAEVVSLDSFFANESVSLITMDIEGAELKALAGAKKIITEQTPKLAVCVYHGIEDLWRVPLFINKHNNSYRYYLRQHSDKTPHETVCYTIPYHTIPYQDDFGKR